MVRSVALLPAGQPHLLDRYQLIGEVATGGMATVYLARIAGVAGFQRFVAIKQLHPHLSRRAEFVEMFLDEARLAASIHHQNVVPILEIGTSEGGYYVVMEYVEGVTFSRLLREGAGRVPRALVLRIVIDVLSGLEAAHELTDNSGMLLGVVHRDCSPQNILVGLDGCSRLTDFGIARASRRLTTTRDGSTKGKLAYMAPEQTAGEDVDRRADLFSVGVLLWEGLAQRRLFKRGSEAEVLRALLEEPIPRLDELVQGMPMPVVECVERALSRDASKRFQTAAAMADGLEDAIGRSPGERIATVREVESYMREKFGGVFAVQRDDVRSFLAGTPSQAGFAGPVSHSGVRHSGVPQPARSEPTRLGGLPIPGEERTRVYSRAVGRERERVVVPPPLPHAAQKEIPNVAPKESVALPSESSLPGAVLSLPTQPISVAELTDPMSVPGEATDPMGLISDSGQTDPLSQPPLPLIEPADTDNEGDAPKRSMLWLVAVAALCALGLVMAAPWSDADPAPAPQTVAKDPKGGESPLGVGAPSATTNGDGASDAKVSPAPDEGHRDAAPPKVSTEKTAKTRSRRARRNPKGAKPAPRSAPKKKREPQTVPETAKRGERASAPTTERAQAPEKPKVKTPAAALDPVDEDLANPYR